MAMSGRKVVGAITSLVSARYLQLQCVKVLHEVLIMPILFNGSETMIWMEEERSKIRAV